MDRNEDQARLDDLLTAFRQRPPMHEGELERLAVMRVCSDLEREESGHPETEGKLVAAFLATRDRLR